MNVLFICDEYPPGKNGGIGTVVQVLGRELVRQGHKVYVSGLYEYSYGESDYEEDHGVRIWRFRYGLNLGREGLVHKFYNRIPNSVKKHLNGKTAFDQFISFIEELIENEKIDVIEIPDWNTFSLHIGFLIQWPEFRAPLVLKSHGSYTYFNEELHEPIKPILNLIDRELFKRADALSAVSRYTAEKNRKLFNIKKEIRVLYNSIDLPVVHSPAKRLEQTVVFTGTLIAKKGIFQLMKAWNSVNKQFPQAELVIYGKGKIKPLKELLNSEALKTVVFNGHVARNVLFTKLSMATVAVFPSYSETFGLVCVEAMSVGCPVIFTTRSCGPEIINNRENGRLVDPDNVDEIANTIIELINDKNMQELYSRNGKETVLAKFNITRSAHEHIDYYKTVIEQFNQGVRS